MASTSAAALAATSVHALANGTALLATSTVATTFPTTSMNGTAPDGRPADTGKCQLLGPFAILVQGALGALALLSLVFKRWRERPQRPVKIWAFDVSKQVFGTLLLHMANLLMSMFSAGEIEAQLAKAAAKTVGAGTDDDWSPNPCSFYLLNLGMDTTVGIPILLLILKVLHIGASKTPLANPPESIQSGHYGNPPRVSWWLKQSILYFVGLLGMKACVFFIFQLCPWIVVVGDWALKWTEGNEALQIAFVMLIFPLIMNAFQYYVIDGFIKKKPESGDNASQHSRAESDGERGGLLAGDEHNQAHEHDDNHGNVVREDSASKAGVRANAAEPSDRDGNQEDQDKQQHDESDQSSSSSATITERQADQQIRASKSLNLQPDGSPLTGT
ncbi:hypothetical protein LTR64_002418 [Lithohypha guttulata]|uniref:uncharacterized protein n=1 Tax=Lithohypha guttulata TaxID=1690604 RepID=UPI002DE05260|nr:hypothetical protein LTR51_001357 [Lithohypha guttulata]